MVPIESEKIIDRKSGSNIFKRFTKYKKSPRKRSPNKPKRKLNTIKPTVGIRLRKAQKIRNVPSTSDLDESSRLGLRVDTKNSPDMALIQRKSKRTTKEIFSSELFGS